MSASFCGFTYLIQLHIVFSLRSANIIKTSSKLFSFVLVMALLLNPQAIGASPAAITDASDDSYMVESGTTLTVNASQASWPMM